MMINPHSISAHALYSFQTFKVKGNILHLCRQKHISTYLMETQPQLNDHNKQEYPPMHTAEHLLNQTMIRLFGCERSKNAHIERKKSKCDYILSREPSTEQIGEIERKINEVICMNLPVIIEYVSRDQVTEEVDLSKLPEDASDTLRIVKIGDYDTCACIGQHVKNTGEIGTFRIISTDYEDNRLRIRFKLEN